MESQQSEFRNINLIPWRTDHPSNVNAASEYSSYPSMKVLRKRLLQNAVQMMAFLKGIILLLRPHIFLGFLIHPLRMSAHMLQLSKWISAQDPAGMNDFYSGIRRYHKRYELYAFLLSYAQLNRVGFDYLEFGVSGGASMNWWVTQCPHADNRFYGFDTFEGLPEQWGHYQQGDMAAGIPQSSDDRVAFIKGLFQHTLPGFLMSNSSHQGRRKVIHLDADLFSSTLFTLCSLAPHLQKGDILLFDEFNVPNHEFLAFKTFCDTYYIKTKLIGAVNNYLQVAVMVE